MTDVDPVRLRRRDRPGPGRAGRGAAGARRAHIEVRSAWGDQHRRPRRRPARPARRRPSASAGWACPPSRRRSARSTSRCPVEHEVERLGRAIAAAHALGAPLHPHLLVLPRRRASPPEDIRDDVLVRMRALADARRGAEVVPSCTRTRRTSTATSPSACSTSSSRSARPPAARLGQRELRAGGRRAPFTDGYAMLRPYLEYLQVKDALAADGEVVPGGRGRRRAARDPHRPARRRLHRLRLARAAPHRRQRPRRLLRTRGVRPRRPRLPRPHRPDRSRTRMTDAHSRPSVRTVAIVGCGIIGLQPRPRDRPAPAADAHRPRRRRPGAVAALADLVGRRARRSSGPRCSRR